MEMQIEGAAFVVGDEVKALEIMPVRFKSSNVLDAEALALACFADLHPEFAADALAGKYQIVVAGENFGGGGKSIEGPIFALRGCGIRVVIADSFARYFLRNSINNALPILVCPGISARVRTGHRLSVDLETAVIVDQTSGETFHAVPLSTTARDIMSSGGLVAYAKKKIAANVAVSDSLSIAK
jgi:3-isopropylmalate/(R)-2-methylmalate dehydratase small subunit